MIEKISSITYYIQIIYFIILIFITLYFFIPILWPSVKSCFHNDDSIINDIYESEIEDSYNEEIKEYEYTKYKTDLQLHKINNDTIDINDIYDNDEFDNDEFNYDDLIEIYKDPKFLHNYQIALNISFNEKISIYTKIYKEKLKDISEAEAKYESNASMYMQHDTTLDRLKRENSEINNVIHMLKYRLKNNNIKTIENQFKSMIFNKNHGFSSLIGRKNIKDYLALKIYTFSQNPKIFFNTYQNVIITGKSGIGKTKLGETIGYIYAKSGILARNKFRTVTSQDLTSKYVNDSGQVTREILLSCLEGFLFIDEAYELGSNNGMYNYNHNSQSVTELVNLLSVYKGLSVVGAAGYYKEMENFKNANKGIIRRFPDDLHLNSYDAMQLTDILLKFINNSAPCINISDKDANTIYTIIDYIYSEDKNIFDKQAGDMEILSGHIIRAIYGNNKITWITGKTKNNSYLILNGMKSYLRIKGIVLSM